MIKNIIFECLLAQVKKFRLWNMRVNHEICAYFPFFNQKLDEKNKSKEEEQRKKEKRIKRKNGEKGWKKRYEKGWRNRWNADKHTVKRQKFRKGQNKWKKYNLKYLNIARHNCLKADISIQL